METGHPVRLKEAQAPSGERTRQESRIVSDPTLRRFLIQMDLPGQPLDMESAVALLEPRGVEVDRSYGPICLNPAMGRYVVRGTATEATRQLVEQISGIQLFRDSPIKPAG
jgi:hypothetical protein